MSSSYLQYLPATYQTTAPQNSPSFLGQYLKIFEKILTGIDDEQLDSRKAVQQLLSADVIGNLFYPRFSFLFDKTDTDFIPPISGLSNEQEQALLAEFNQYIGFETIADPLASYVQGQSNSVSWKTQFEAWLSEFLQWLGGWVAIVVQHSWSIDKKRTVVAEILALYRIRGTAFGLQSLLNLLLDLPMTLQGISYTSDGEQQNINGQLSIAVAPQQSKPFIVSDNPAAAFIVRDSFEPDMPMVAGYAPGLFTITLNLPTSNAGYVMTSSGTQTVLTLFQTIQELAEQLKPAASQIKFNIQPSFALPVIDPKTKKPTSETKGYAALGNNTLLGSGAING